MIRICTATFCLAGGLLGCASGPASAPAAPAAPAAVTLAYAAQGSPLGYASADTGHLRMDIPGMGAMDVVYHVASTSRLALTRGTGGLDATLTITALEGQLSNPQAGTSALDNTLIPRDPARLAIDATGRILQASLPDLSRGLREVATASTLFYRPFIRLPRGPVRPGASWVDTVEVNDQLATLSLQHRQELRSTYAGDTVVAGRRLARITATGALTMSASGDANGMQIEYRLAGQATHRALWDAARGVLVERRLEENATGTMNILGAPMDPIPVTQRTRSVVRLQEGG